MSRLIIRAITNKGGHVDLEQPRMDAILTFTLIFRCAEANEPLPKLSWIPEPWRLELFPEFLKPDGAIVAFHMVTIEDPEQVVNYIYFTPDNEGRHQLMVHDENIISASRAFLDFNGEVKSIDQQPDFTHHEMSGDWHMGYHDEPKEMKVLKSRQVMTSGEVMASPKFDGAGVTLVASQGKSHPIRLIDLAPKIPMTTNGLNASPPFRSKANSEGKVAKGIKHHEIMHEIVKGKLLDHDMYSAPAIDTIWYRIYVNGIPSDMVTDDLSFMDHINEYMANIKGKDVILSKAIPGSMEMPGDLYALLTTFLLKRSFKIGAHPVDEPLEDGNDAWHSIFWDRNQRETLYCSPLGHDDVFF